MAKEGGEVCGLLQNEDKAPADRNQPLLVHHRIPSKLDLICAEWRRGNLSKQVIAGRDHKAKEDGVTAVTTLETVITEAISLWHIWGRIWIPKHWTQMLGKKFILHAIMHDDSRKKRKIMNSTTFECLPRASSVSILTSDEASSPHCKSHSELPHCVAVT